MFFFLGIALEDRDRLFGAFIQYKSMRQASQLSSFSSGSLGSLSQVRSVPDVSGGFVLSCPLPSSSWTGWRAGAAADRKASGSPRPRSPPPTRCPSDAHIPSTDRSLSRSCQHTCFVHAFLGGMPFRMPCAALQVSVQSDLSLDCSIPVLSLRTWSTFCFVFLRFPIFLLSENRSIRRILLTTSRFEANMKWVV